jgi:type I restriction enzyme M protein
MDAEMKTFWLATLREIKHRPPREILARLRELEAEIQAGMDELEGMLK